MLLWEKEYPLISLIVTFALLHMKAGGFPEGGSLEFARAIEKRYTNLGGKIFFKKRCKRFSLKMAKQSGFASMMDEPFRAIT